MFSYNFAFNQDLSKWPVQAGCNFNSMLFNSAAFSQDLNSWRAKVTSPSSTCPTARSFANMFYGTKCPVPYSILPAGAFCQSTQAPSTSPSVSPTRVPSKTPSLTPSSFPSRSSTPSQWPSVMPSKLPSRSPSKEPSRLPSVMPTKLPSGSPSTAPSKKPVEAPLVKECVRKAFKKRTWCCTKRAECKSSIKKACRTIFYKAAKTEEFLVQRTNQVVRFRCQ